MIWLPKFLFLFQTIPVIPPQDFFKTINKLFSSFIWSNKAHRLSRKLLQNKGKGGLDFPNLELYYYSTHSFYINKIIINRSEEDMWVNIEDHQLGENNLFLALFTKRKIKNISFVTNSTLRTWEKPKHILGIEISVPKNTFLWNNPSITIQKEELKWKSWSDKGITTIGDITCHTKIKHFEQLVTEFNLINKELFRYLQLKSWITDNFVLNYNTEPSVTQRLFLNSGENRKLIQTSVQTPYKSTGR